jgi:hypothetical protein
MVNSNINRQHTALQEAFIYFNEVLFLGQLPDCLLNFSRSKKRAMGFFAAFRWEERQPVVQQKQKPRHEISLCPDWVNRDVEEVYSTLVHEMVHLWQQEFGKPSRTGYHNKEFARKMITIGLFPSTTGQPGGKLIGQSVSHYILKDGAFKRAFDALPNSLLLPFIYTHAQTNTNTEKNTSEFKDPKNKVKYHCPICKNNVWGKPNLRIECGDCHSKFRCVL